MAGDAARIEHGLALALGGRCPLCAELAKDLGVLARRPCSSCGGVFADDDLADRLVEEYADRSRERLFFHLAALTGAGLVLGFVPLLGALTLAVGFLLFQVRVTTPALALLSRKRRFVAQWILRLFTATLAVLSSVGVTLASLVGLGGWVTAVVAPVTLGVTWTSARAYLVWQMGRERKGLRITALEITLLVWSFLAITAAVIGSVVVSVGAVSLFQLAKERLIQWLS